LTQRRRDGASLNKMDGVHAERGSKMTIGFHAAMPRKLVGALAACCTATLVACGGAGSGNSQVVATVGGDEITETQVNHALERQANLKPEQVESASRQAVSGLVEQAIVLQKAHDLKLDRDERVMQNIEAMKRELIVNAYVSRIADGAGKPADKDIQAYLDDNPVLFSQRRIYTFQELTVDAPEAQIKKMEADLTQLKSAPEIADYLKTRQIPVHSTQTTLPAENVPQALLARVAQLKVGQGVIVSNGDGLRILMLLAARESPIAEDKARPAILAYLGTQNKRQAIQKELASLHATAKVAYFGKYADLAASAPAAAASTVIGAASAAASGSLH
jgi:EpsD family peptidyl-prolyl cis-trans isomerase